MGVCRGECNRRKVGDARGLQWGYDRGTIGVQGGCNGVQRECEGIQQGGRGLQ